MEEQKTVSNVCNKTASLPLRNSSTKVDGDDGDRACRIIRIITRDNTITLKRSCLLSKNIISNDRHRKT